MHLVGANNFKWVSRSGQVNFNRFEFESDLGRYLSLMFQVWVNQILKHRIFFRGLTIYVNVTGNIYVYIHLKDKIDVRHILVLL